ncbi:MAG: helix-turn-helix transcriptional regulator [Blastocatellia bacterium]
MAKLRANLAAHLPSLEGFLEKVSVEMPRRQERTPLLESLMEAAEAGTWTKITYKSAGFTSSQHILPGNIYTLRGLWYCRAYSHERLDYRVYRIDRIESLDQPAGDFQPYVPPDPQPYHHESNPEVIATLTPKGVAMTESDPNLGAQVIRAENGWGTLAFRCPVSELNYYARLFASFGSEIRVEAPDDLRLRLFELGLKLIERYKKTVT